MELPTSPDVPRGRSSGAGAPRWSGTHDPRRQRPGPGAAARATLASRQNPLSRARVVRRAGRGIIDAAVAVSLFRTTLHAIVARDARTGTAITTRYERWVH